MVVTMTFSVEMMVTTIRTRLVAGTRNDYPGGEGEGVLLGKADRREIGNF